MKRTLQTKSKGAKDPKIGEITKYGIYSQIIRAKVV